LLVFKERIEKYWEQMFSELLPRFLAKSATVMADKLEAFCKLMEQRPQLRLLPHFEIAVKQLKGHQQSITNVKTTQALLVAANREANRTFMPAIRTAMEPAYNLCRAEAGKFVPASAF
jgi:hypothetical protein